MDWAKTPAKWVLEYGVTYTRGFTVIHVIFRYQYKSFHVENYALVTYWYHVDAYHIQQWKVVTRFCTNSRTHWGLNKMAEFLKCTFFNNTVCIGSVITEKFVQDGPINNNSALAAMSQCQSDALDIQQWRWIWCCSNKKKQCCLQKRIKPAIWNSSRDNVSVT